ncbi:MAG: hypothetical protein WAW02_07210 [Sideroxyarcus sp.]
MAIITTASWDDEVRAIIAQFIAASASPILTNRCSGVGFSLSGDIVSDRLHHENWEKMPADEVVASFSEWLIKYISHNQDALIIDATDNIATYLSQHGVTSSSPDQFKFAFWFGWVLAERCDAIGKPQFSKLSKLITLMVMDLLLGMMPKSNPLPQDMRKKLDRAVSVGKECEYYGKHGIYTSYKIISKLVNSANLSGSNGWR